jgi:hypothetical protein
MGMIWFVLHLVLTLGAYILPFIFNWEIGVAAYVLVLLQFIVFGKCLVNEKHALEEVDHQTFYSL